MPSTSTHFPWALHQTRLDNGLRVVVCPDATVPLAAVNLWYDVGSRHEAEGKHGFAHLFEHLMFEGSAHVDKGGHFAAIEGCGGDNINASTNPDRTNYYQTVPSGQLALALWLEADRMGSLALTQETLDNQREVVKNERRERYDNVPYGTWMEEMVALAYPAGHPYATSTIGSMAELDGARLSDFVDFHATYYAPDNAVLTVVGDVDPDEVVALARRYFGGIAARGAFPQPDPAPLPRRFGTGRHLRLYRDVPTPRLFLAHRSPRFGSADAPAVNVLTAIVGRGRGSRLYRELVTAKNLAQAAGSYLSAWGFMHFDSVVMGSCAPSEGVEPDDLLAAYVAVCDDVVRDGVTEEEVERVRAMLAGDWLRELATAGSRADAIGRFATLHGDADAIRAHLDDLLAVTADDVQRVAADVLHADNRIVLSFLPEADAADVADAADGITEPEAAA
ncbi:pitrilysin family protein [Streptomyces sp. SID3343]|uniref:M16 family metallopeptidase n=1 Tax=Streptomyces sp. SID3343 TaxID=2690260 RepID=UPI0031F9C76F